MTETTQLLSRLNAGVLNALARRVGIPKHVRRKPDLIAELDRLLHENLSALGVIFSATEEICLRKLRTTAAGLTGPLCG